MTENRPSADAILKEVTKAEENAGKGKLKIFFGYAAGVGKTYAMLEEAHAMKKAGVDVVIGYVEPHQRPATLALIKGLPQIPPTEVSYQSATLLEFDIDSALERQPKLILVDELAHTNAKGCRHLKRYQDIEELLRMGIDVYTTVNVQHIEGLRDVVQSITGVAVRERIPDSIFDDADKVELVDIEPEDLVIRLSEGKIYKDKQAQRALQNFFTKENLIALREIALRRTADRMNITVEKNKTTANNSTYVTDEHILMCLSSSPFNAAVVRTAAKMAEAFHGSFTALFVEGSDFNEMSEDNKKRLRENLRLAEQLGAKIATVYGDDIAYQVAEYAKVSGISKIVLGRPISRFILGFKSQNYVDKLITYAPDLEVYVIPNKFKTAFSNNERQKFKIEAPVISLADTMRAVFFLGLATLVGFVFRYFDFSETNTITVYILASLFIAVITEGKIYSLISSLLSVILFNYFFTEPIFTLDTHDTGYLATFVIMFASAFITSTFTKRARAQAKQAVMSAYRTEVLLETSQKLQFAKDKNGILLKSLEQIQKLLSRSILIFPAAEDGLGSPLAVDSKQMAEYLTAEEFAVAQWVFVNNKHAGASTNTLSGSKCLYMSIRSNNTVFAVAGIPMEKGEKLDSFDKSLLIAMLSEIGLALENEAILSAKNEITIKAEQEELRSRLLRTISHDFRTPLARISGSSGVLLEDLDSIDRDTIRWILGDISADSLWLSNLVENLLNMTRIDEGELRVIKKSLPVAEVISGALSRITKRSGNRIIETVKPDEALYVPMDSQLIMQVIINLVDNAVKYTKEDSVIKINYHTNGKKFILSVEDNGSGIPKEFMGSIFKPFFTTEAGYDKQRGMGLGLSTCKSIIEAHGGTIKGANNNFGGATFTMVLPMEEQKNEK